MSAHSHVQPLLDSPLAEAHHVACALGRGGAGGEETVATHRLVFPLGGVFKWSVGARSVIADANTVMLFHADFPYRVSHPADGGDECVAISYQSDILEEAIGDLRSARFWILPIAVHARVRLALLRLQHAPVGEREEIALQLLSAFAEPKIPDAKANAAVEAARELLTIDPDAAPDVRTLATRVGFSSFHFARSFRARTGTSIHSYRQSLRLAAALHRLQGGETNLGRLAHDLRFASHSHFSSAFKAHFGVAPSRALEIARRR